MTREEAKELLPIIQAFSEGKTIEIYNNREWNDLIIESVNFDCEPSCYRIKPEPKYRPFKTRKECWEEMMKHQPFGWVMGKMDEHFYHIDFVYSCNPDNGYGVRLSKNISIDFEHMFRDFKFADGKPFGIKEE